jgi:hypothetical protein
LTLPFTVTSAPARTKWRTDSELPTAAYEITDKLYNEPILATPIHDSPDPMRMKFLTDKLDPTVVKPNTETSPPIFAKERVDKLLDRLACP